MSKAYYFVKNFNWPEVQNLLCYGTKHPEVLTSQQKITRLYRATLRRYQAHKLEGYKADFGDYNSSLNAASRDFRRLLKLNNDSVEFQNLIKKYENLQEELYDPSMIIDECRPYAASSARYLIWDNYALDNDPFGFYKKRLLSDKHPLPHMPFYEDYPQNDTHWNIYETFPENFDDTDFEKEEVREFNENNKQ